MTVTAEEKKNFTYIPIFYHVETGGDNEKNKSLARAILR